MVGARKTVLSNSKRDPIDPMVRDLRRNKNNDSGIYTMLRNNASGSEFGLPG